MEQQIGEIISRVRQDAHLTQEEFASRLGVTPQAVSKWERGQGLPDITMVEGICRILQVSADELLGIAPGVPVTEQGDFDAQREIQACMLCEPMLLEIGIGLIETVTEGINSGAFNEARKKLVAKTGYLMPIVHVRDNIKMAKTGFRIAVYDRTVCEDRIVLEDGTGYQTIVDALVSVCRESYAEILNKQLVKCMVDTVKEFYPGVADGVCPEQIGYLELEYLLRELIIQKKPIHDLIHILEYAEWEMVYGQQRDIQKVASVIAGKL